MILTAVQFALTIGTIVLGLYIASKVLGQKCAPPHMRLLITTHHVQVIWTNQHPLCFWLLVGLLNVDHLQGLGSEDTMTPRVEKIAQLHHSSNSDEEGGNP